MRNFAGARKDIGAAVILLALAYFVYAKGLPWIKSLGKPSRPSAPAEDTRAKEIKDRLLTFNMMAGDDVIGPLERVLTAGFQVTEDKLGRKATVNEWSAREESAGVWRVKLEYALADDVHRMEWIYDEKTNTALAATMDTPRLLAPETVKTKSAKPARRK